MTDTIVALSSGRPPAAIGVIRVSGPAAFAAVGALADTLPEPRRAGLRVLRDAEGAILDRALVLCFPGLGSATGEDLAELHCHGGRAVTAAVEAALVGRHGIRAAEPGEFTRRALANGRIDLAEAEGLADLLAAETEAQRRTALLAAEGQLSGRVRGWLATLAGLAARVEAAIDYDDETETAGAGDVRAEVVALAAALSMLLTAPPVERLRDGVRVVIAGPPNSGKSTLINALAEREVAIVSPIAGTTRDRIEAAVQRDGVPYLLSDTAGLTDTADPIEAIGVGLARAAVRAADVLLWLGDDLPPPGALWVHARCDLPGRESAPMGAVAVSAVTGFGVGVLWDRVADRAGALLPGVDQLAINARQRALVRQASEALADAAGETDPLLLAEQLRIAHRVLAAITGADATEAMLDALFSRFCLGK